MTGTAGLKRSILIVEDDGDDAFFLQDALRRSDIHLPIVVVHDGQEAVEYLARAKSEDTKAPGARPCLTLLDLNLPHRTGLDVLQWIREQEHWHELVVIVLTSSCAESDMLEAYRLGANAYVVKPADATKLRDFSDLVKRFWLGWNQVPGAGCWA